MENRQPYLSQETIVAIATPPGRGGIAVVRLSGPEALRVARTVVPLRGEPVSHRARYGQVLDRDGAVLDDALLTWFAAPRSYTGEDVVEISTHGAPVIVQTVIELLLERGARLAHAGEFTERAFVNGRLDLTQAEAVRDLIDASTVMQARLAAEQLGGSLQREVRPVKDALVMLIAALEAGIDFAEDDLETMPAEAIAAQIATMLAPLERLLASFAHFRVVREGLRIALVGAPNAGKSSLFNRLLERERAIVTPIAGTTRDLITERAVMGGVPVELMDTAGLRETDDVVERMGVQRSHEAMAEADVVLHVVEAAAALLMRDAETLPGGTNVLQVYSKADLLGEAEAAALRDTGALVTSASTGAGVAELREAILRMAGASEATAAHAVLTNVRQRDSMQRAVAALAQARTALDRETPHEMLLLDLYEALRSLDELLGQTTADDVLHRIFSTFCIGK